MQDVRKNDSSERQGRGRGEGEIGALQSRLVAGLTNKSDDKICILVALLSLRSWTRGFGSAAPFMSRPTFAIHLPLTHPPHIASFSLPPSLFPSFAFILSLSTGSNPNSDHEFSNPFRRNGGGRRNRHEKSMESSLVVRLKSPESHRDADSTRKPVSENGSIDLRTLLRFGWREL